MQATAQTKLPAQPSFLRTTSGDLSLLECGSKTGEGTVGDEDSGQHSPGACRQLRGSLPAVAEYAQHVLPIYRRKPGNVRWLGDFTGTPQFVGGSNPTTYAGFAFGRRVAVTGQGRSHGRRRARRYLSETLSARTVAFSTDKALRLRVRATLQRTRRESATLTLRGSAITSGTVVCDDAHGHRSHDCSSSGRCLDSPAGSCRMGTMYAVRSASRPAAAGSRISEERLVVSAFEAWN
jgi:hypothetical protein